MDTILTARLIQAIEALNERLDRLIPLLEAAALSAETYGDPVGLAFIEQETHQGPKHA